MSFPKNDKAIPGKVFVWLLFGGFGLFAAIMGFGTYYIGKAMTPGLVKQNAERMHQKHLDAHTP